MHGDKVVVRVESAKGDRGRKEGIVRVSRARTRIVGRFEQAGQHGFVVPRNRRLTQDLFVEKGEMGRARTGDLVVAEISAYPQAQRNPEGKIARVLG
jgi:ribonuclease R